MRRTVAPLRWDVAMGAVVLFIVTAAFMISGAAMLYPLQSEFKGWSSLPSVNSPPPAAPAAFRCYRLSAPALRRLPACVRSRRRPLRASRLPCIRPKRSQVKHRRHQRYYMKWNKHPHHQRHHHREIVHAPTTAHGISKAVYATLYERPSCPHVTLPAHYHCSTTVHPPLVRRYAGLRLRSTSKDSPVNKFQHKINMEKTREDYKKHHKQELIVDSKSTIYRCIERSWKIFVPYSSTKIL